MFIKDMDCKRDTPVVLGVKDTPVYGKGIRIKPGHLGEQMVAHAEELEKYMI